MARASFRADLESLKFFLRKVNDPQLKQKIQNIAHEKGIVAIISQAISDNFDKEGPGWAPLKPKTIRASVKGKTKKLVADMTDRELLKHESKARAQTDPNSADQPFRRVLQRTGLLRNTVTNVGKTYTKKSGKTTVTGTNVYEVKGTTIIWGTNLPYAEQHQKGDSSKNLPARPFLVIRPEWQDKLEEWSMTQIVIYLREIWGGILK